ncbi:ABC transporter ATP-binding protein [Micromonospora sp. NBC_01655]|uniref:ABC transporter ATP-binding protein n=1 Tax=Micromonospora sp. NBC_01655 TaxID=2975983 RepID=UPI002256EA4A|nr:ABC transporter ATP-binding protein [Micromonospora sp. NBC_01655]MCX4474631.1 ABC transporter ATP-binding protein [Micromonospora sp. NBC_01655]
MRSFGRPVRAARGAEAPAVQLQGLTKRFGPVLACADVSMTVLRGRIHGLLGQNGAGKTTLMRMLAGLVRPDAGRILVAGRPVTVTDPATATALGIAMVHQHFSLVGRLRVWENVALGGRGRLDSRWTRREIGRVADGYGLLVDPDRRVDELTTSERQRVELVKCLIRAPQVLILDEPTSTLTPPEARHLLSVLRRVVSDESRAVVLISHDLDELAHAADEVTVMRDGAVLARRSAAEVDVGELGRLMVGDQLPAAVAAPAGEPREQVRLRIRDAWATQARRPVLRGLDLRVRAGEIVGVAGVEGSGQGALADLLSSLLPLDRGNVEVDGNPVPPGRPGAMQRAGVGVVPEDRHVSGCVLDMSVAENLAMTDLGPVSRWGFVSRGRLRQRAEATIREFAIGGASPDTPLRLLSGGNQQRVVLARELGAAASVLVVAQPTRGLDAAAVEHVFARIGGLAAQGVAVLLISSDLADIRRLAHRIVVLHRGAVVGELTQATADPQRLGLLLGGRPE